MPVNPHSKSCVGDEMRRFQSGALHSGTGGKVVKDKKQALAIALSACGKSKYAESFEALGFSEDASEAAADLVAETLDFSRCQRPDGSFYGTSGRCRKGSESGPKEKTAAQVKGQLDKLFKMESEARKAGDHDKAKEYMRAHTKLAKELNDLEKKRGASKAARTPTKPQEKGTPEQRMVLKRLEERLDDAVTVKERNRISTAIKELTLRMK